MRINTLRVVSGYCPLPLNRGDRLCPAVKRNGMGGISLMSYYVMRGVISWLYKRGKNVKDRP